VHLLLQIANEMAYGKQINYAYSIPRRFFGVFSLKVSLSLK
jgi:hypothetical protein